MKSDSCGKVQLGLAAPFKHFSDLWQQCALQPPDVQLFAKDSTDGIPVHRTLLLSLSPTLSPLLTSFCCATPIKVMLSESREAAVSAAVALLYTGSYSLSELLKGSLTFFEALAEVREVLECLGIVLDENSLTVVDHIASSSVVLVKKEQGSEDRLSEEELEPADEELASDVPLIIDVGESPPTWDEGEPTAPQTIDIGESPMLTININDAGEIKKEDEHEYDANDTLKKRWEERLSDSVAEVPLLKVNIVSADKTKKCGRKSKKLEGEEKGLVTKLKRKYKKEVKVGEPEGEGGVLRRKNRCELCTYSTNNKAALQRHIELVHSEGAPPPSTCNLCGFAAASSGALKAHMTCIHSRGETAFPCPHCSVRPRSQQRLDKHLAWHVKLNEAKAKRALERESRKSSTSKEEEKKVQAKTSNLLLVNTIVNDIVLDVTATDNLS